MFRSSCSVGTVQVHVLSLEIGQAREGLLNDELIGGANVAEINYFVAENPKRHG